LVEGDRVVGIVTDPDLLGLFVRAMGAQEFSSRAEVELGDAETLGTAVGAVEGGLSRSRWDR
jgi:hypothetical protein